MRNESEVIARQFSTSARRLRSVGKMVFDQSPLTEKIYVLRVKELQFQKALLLATQETSDGKAAVAKACFQVGVTTDWAEHFLKSRRYKEWLADRIEEIELNAGLTPYWIAKKHKQHIEGEIQLSNQQLASLSELGERVWPKVQKVEHRVEKVDSSSMDDLMKVQEEVDALERKLIDAHKPKEIEAA